jgi:hypothetical protein
MNRRNQENDDDEDSDNQGADDYSESPVGKGKGKAVQKSRNSDLNGQKTKNGKVPRLSVVNRPSAVITTTSASATVVSGTTINGGGMLNLGDLTQLPVQVPRKVMDDNFEEWMKMATDNVSEEVSRHCGDSNVERLDLPFAENHRQ